MSRQKTWVAGGMLVTAAVVLVAGRPTTGQPPAARLAAPGPYQMQVSGQAPNSTVFVLDSSTGRVWYKQTIHESKWTDMGTPVKGQADRGQQ